jgi:2-methylcitrate dehydratase
MVAIPLIFGTLTAEHYENKAAADPRIDALRAKMQVVENKQYSIDYLDPEKRSIGNAVQVFFTDGSATPRVEIQYPIGHRRRRREAIPLLRQKFLSAVGSRFSQPRTEAMAKLFDDREKLEQMSVDAFMELWRESQNSIKPPRGDF